MKKKKRKRLARKIAKSARKSPPVRISAKVMPAQPFVAEDDSAKAAAPISDPSYGLASGNEPFIPPYDGDPNAETISRPSTATSDPVNSSTVDGTYHLNSVTHKSNGDVAYQFQQPPIMDYPAKQQIPPKTVLYCAFEKGTGFVGNCIDNICGGSFCHAELNLRYGLAYRCHLQGNDKLIDPSPYDDGWTLVPVELDAAAALAWCQARDNSVYNLAGALAFLPRKWGWDDFADWIERLSHKGQVFCSESVAEICNDCGGPNFGAPEDIDPDTLFRALKIATDLPILTGSEYEKQFAPK